MIQSRLITASERIIEPMIDLARCSKLGRIIVAGADSAALMFELHRRGYVRVATTANCGLPDSRYSIGVVSHPRTPPLVPAFRDARRPACGRPDEIGSAGNCDDVWATIVGQGSRRSSSTCGIGGTGNRTLASIAEGHQGEMKFFHGTFMGHYLVVDFPHTCAGHTEFALVMREDSRKAFGYGRSSPSLALGFGVALFIEIHREVAGRPYDGQSKVLPSPFRH
jgi:hypothetical protein